MQTVALSGVDHFIVHARKAILDGSLDPAQNRTIPPLNYDYVYELVAQHGHKLKFTLNGGVQSMADIEVVVMNPLCQNCSQRTW